MTEPAPAEPKVPLPKEIWVLVSASFVIALGYGLVAPALPQFARSFGVSVPAATFVVSAFALMRLAFAPASGRLVTRLGERPIYIAGVLIVAASTGASALAANYWQLLIFRGLGGIGSTMFTVSAMGLLIRISPPRERGRVSGLYATSFLLGNVTGPLIGGLLVTLGLRVPFIIYTLALLVAAAVVYFALRGSHLAQIADDGAVPEVPLRVALRSPTYRAALAGNFGIGMVVFGVRVAIVPLLVVEALHADRLFSGLVLTAFAVGNAAVLALAGRLSDEYGRRLFPLVGLVVTGIATIGMGLSPNVWLLLAISVVAGLGAGIATPPQQAAPADLIGSKARGGSVLAGFQMVSDVGAVLGPIVGGWLAGGGSYGAALVVAGVVLVVVAIPWWFAPARPQPLRA